MKITGLIYKLSLFKSQPFVLVQIISKTALIAIIEVVKLESINVEVVMLVVNILLVLFHGVLAAALARILF